MRVIAGRYKGHKLVSPKGRVRPTLDRVREAVFGSLGGIEGADVLDLYAGTGALGIEAISRGAVTATFVDLDISTVRKNVEVLAIDNTEIVRNDSIRFLKKAAASKISWDVVFIDPPYSHVQQLAEPLNELVASVMTEAGKAVVESAIGHPLELNLQQLSHRTYGDTVISIYTK